MRQKLRPMIMTICNVSIAILLLSSIFSILGSNHWLFHLFEHFRLQYIFSLLIISILYIFYKRYKSAILAVLALAMNISLTLPHISYFPSKSSKNYHLEVMTYNVQRSNPQKQKVLDYILDIQPDIVALQEIDQSWATALQALRPTYPFFKIHPRGSNFGIALFSKYPLFPMHLETERGTPFITATFKIKMIPVFIMTVHPLPPVSKPTSIDNEEQLRVFADLLNKAQSPYKIVLGDFNQTPWSSRLRRFKTATGLIETSKSFDYRATWPSKALFPLGLKLDYIFHSPGIKPVACKRGPHLGSDHLPISCQIIFKNS